MYIYSIFKIYWIGMGEDCVIQSIQLIIIIPFLKQWLETINLTFELLKIHSENLSLELMGSC